MARLDQYLVENRKTASRAQAQALVKAGLVLINGAVADKVSRKVAAGDDVEVTGELHPFVSRGGMKLEKALAHFAVYPAGKSCLDLGASTGGF